MRRIRTLGLAAVAALALTAILGTGVASAAGFSADQYPAEFSGADSSSHLLSFNTGEATCDAPNFGGGISGPSTAIASSWTVNGKCKVSYPPGSESTMSMNGCKFTFNPSAKKTGEALEGTFDIGPASCGPIVVKPFNCEITIGAQNGLKAVYQNIGEGSGADVKVTAQATGLKYTEAGGASCASKGTFGNGTWSGSWDVNAKNLSGESVGMHVSAEPAVGLYITGKQSEESSNQPKFEAETYPAVLKGEQDAGDKFAYTTGGFTTSCDVATFAGSIGAASSQLTLTSSYDKCKAEGPGGLKIPSAVSMNGCQYVIDVLNAGPPYTSSFGISCPGGKAIEVKDTSLFLDCTIVFPAQSGLKAVGLVNSGKGSGRQVAADPEVSGIEYSASGGSCNLGKATNGTLGGSFDVRGVL